MRSCSPGRIRPGLRARRAMKNVKRSTNAVIYAAARVALLREADECVRPYTTDVENR